MDKCERIVNILFEGVDKPTTEEEAFKVFSTILTKYLAPLFGKVKDYIEPSLRKKIDEVNVVEIKLTTPPSSPSTKQSVEVNEVVDTRHRF
jgi:hypothetical protein